MNYNVNEIFESIQGEGYNTGKRVVFIRLCGCNLRCPWCDTDHTKQVSIMTEKEIMQEIEQYKSKAVIITGGEPTVQNLGELLFILKQQGYWVGIETNGTNDISQYSCFIDYIAVSPKANSAIKIKFAHEIRVVNDNLTIKDLNYLSSTFKAQHYFVSPLELNEKMNIADCLNLIADTEAQTWKLSLQTHKLANIR